MTDWGLDVLGPRDAGMEEVPKWGIRSENLTVVGFVN